MFADAGRVFGRVAFDGLGKGGATRALRLGVSATCLVLATAVPVSAQVNDLGGATLSGAAALNALLGFTEVTNGALNLNPGIATPVTYAGGFTDSLGAFQLTKSGVGSLTLTGSGLSNYAAQTLLSGGVLQAGAANVLSPNSVMRITGGTLDLGGFDQTVAGLTGAAGTVQSTGAATLTIDGTGTRSYGGFVTGAIAIVKSGSGTQTFSGNNDYSGGTTINAGTLRFVNDTSLGTGAITVAGDSTLGAAVAGRTLANAIVLNADLTVDGAATLAGVISGGPGNRLIKDTTGSLSLTGVNTFSGGVLQTRGALYIGNDSALGTGTFTTTANTVFGTTGELTLTIANDMQLGGTLNVQRPSGAQTLTFNGTISDAPGLQGSLLLLTGEAPLIVNGANSYSGLTRIATGVFGFGNELAAGTSRITASGTGGLAAYADNMNIANRIFTGTDLEFDTRGYTTTLSGVIEDGVQGPDRVPGGIVKVGDGTLILSADNLYTDKTIVAVGTLLLTGSVAGDVDVLVDATFGGTGTVGGTVTVANGGTLAPGSSPGLLTINSDLLLSSGSFLAFELGAPDTVGGPLNDLIQVNGNLTLDGTVNVTESAGGSFGTGAYRLINYTGALTDNGLLLGTTPAGYTGSVQTVIGGQVNLIVTTAGTLVQYWDGPNFVGNGIVDGGTGNWTVADTNWTDASPSTVNSSWVDGSVAVFAGSTGTVTLQSTFVAEGLQFTTDGYLLQNGALDIAAGGMWVSTEGVTATIASQITGAGELKKQGDGTLVLTNANTYGGGTQLEAGTLVVQNTNALGGGVLTIFGDATLANGGFTVDVGNDVVTLGNGLVNASPLGMALSGTISGPGSISQVGTGILVLTQNNSFTNLGINAGTVALGNNGAAGIGSIAINNNATLGFVANNLVIENDIQTTGNGLVSTGVAGLLPGLTATLNGDIGGPGSISSILPGNLILNGNNSFTNLGINAGTVTVGSDTAAGIGSIAINNNATLANNKNVTLANDVESTANGLVDVLAGTVLTLNGNVGGPGSISQVGAGNLVLNGDNSFTNLGINQGTVTVGSDTAAGIGSIAINNNATLANNKNVTLANDVESTANGLVDVLAGTVLTLDGDVGGAGSISQVGAGNLVLNGNNSFTNLGINQGTVTVGSDTAAGIGSIAINNDATLANNKDVTLANSVVTTANGLVDVLAGTVLTLDGDVGGPGSISQVGAGNLVLNGNNSFVNLGINQGTVTVGSDTAAGSGSVALNSNATLANNKDVTLANGVITTGNGLVDVLAGTSLTLDGNVSGPGSISQVGLGTLVLNGDNSFTNLGINQGTVAVGSNTAAGIGTIAINNNATLAAAANGVVLTNSIFSTANGIIDAGPLGNVFTLNGSIFGPGSISQVGAGNLVLNGTNSYTNLGINQGTVTIGNASAVGNGLIAINNNATLAAGASGIVLANAITTTANGIIDAGPLGSVFTLNGAINGAGSISQVGAGNLVLNGNNSYVNLGINQGTVTLGTNTAAGKGAIAINNNATLAAGVSGLNIANVITTTGAGTVNSGPGMLTLSGVIDGLGGIAKTGAGVLNLTAANTYSGPTTVTAGTLNVTGGIAKSATTVQSGASLIGTGSVGSLTVQAGGRVSPGTVPGGPGTLTANGALTLASGSTLVIDAYGDLVRATGPSTIAGNLIVNPTGGGYKFGDTVIVSSSGRTGTFATTTFTGSFGSVVEFEHRLQRHQRVPAAQPRLAGRGERRHCDGGQRVRGRFGL